ncbi:uncharacterized protein BYT42DRAFT_543461 [Radiomyces spectabilis]|uniref:uncharacterized protein n=1 Tax=Radiomyces spectabilis TaxID=64574 RepID=UPI0022202384|nr:uncharacterized protein BYT42DRAFT_543461 [Radiomyces spectabilis]KAI8388098.1 hypothetical protein BYT42DRAFT_543461 [Radiomyces spectabilis]
MATLEELIILQHSTYKELKTCLEPEKKAGTVYQQLEAKCAEHNEIVCNQQKVTSQLKAAAKREYLQLQSQNNGVFKFVFSSHNVKLDEQREKYRRAFQAEQDAVVKLEIMQAEKEKIRKQTLAAKEEYQRYKDQHLQLDRFIKDIFQEATDVENYPELTALEKKLEQENQAESRSLEKAIKALTSAIVPPSPFDGFSNSPTHAITLIPASLEPFVLGAKHQVKRAVRSLQQQRVTECSTLESLLNSMVLRKDGVLEDQHAQIKSWESQIRRIIQEMQISLLPTLTLQVDSLQWQIKKHETTIMTLKDDVSLKKQLILDNILSDMPVYDPTGAPPAYTDEPTAAAP